MPFRIPTSLSHFPSHPTLRPWPWPRPMLLLTVVILYLVLRIQRKWQTKRVSIKWCQNSGHKFCRYMHLFVLRNRMALTNSAPMLTQFLQRTSSKWKKAVQPRPEYPEGNEKCVQSVAPEMFASASLKYMPQRNN